MELFLWGLLFWRALQTGIHILSILRINLTTIMVYDYGKRYSVHRDRITCSVVYSILPLQMVK